MIPHGICYMKKLLDMFLSFFNIASSSLKEQPANKNWPACFQLPFVLLECDQACGSDYHWFLWVGQDRVVCLGEGVGDNFP